VECRLWDQLDASGEEKRGSRREQGIGPIAPDGFERGIDLAAGVSIENLDLQSERARPLVCLENADGSNPDFRSARLGCGGMAPAE
jgi:hypothetical protein